MQSCPKYMDCSAPLCPLDRENHKRTWIILEEVCKSKEHKELPWIRRQKKLNRTAPATLMDQPLGLEYLSKTAPKKRILSAEHKAKLLSGLARAKVAV